MTHTKTARPSQNRCACQAFQLIH